MAFGTFEIHGLTPNKIRILYSGNVNHVSSVNVDNYSILGNRYVNVDSVSIVDAATVDLNINNRTPIYDDITYTVTIRNVESFTGDPMTSPSATFRLLPGIRAVERIAENKLWLTFSHELSINDTLLQVGSYLIQSDDESVTLPITSVNFITEKKIEIITDDPTAGVLYKVRLLSGETVLTALALPVFNETASQNTATEFQTAAEYYPSMLCVYINGLRMVLGVDYNESSGNLIVFSTPPGVAPYVDYERIGGLVSTVVKNEIPSGAIDNVNDIYTTANAVLTGTEQIYVNGVRLVSSVDYTVIDSNQFQLATPLLTGSSIVMDSLMP